MRHALMRPRTIRPAAAYCNANRFCTSSRLLVNYYSSTITQAHVALRLSLLDRTLKSPHPCPPPPNQPPPAPALPQHATYPVP